ncbi:unnamed protein product [Discosporangium mesarthrocarpum]
MSAVSKEKRKGEKRRKRDSTDCSSISDIKYLLDFQAAWKRLPKDMNRMFDPKMPEVRRNELFQMMCEEGERLRRRYAWAIPDGRALRIIEHFGCENGIVEVGSGLGYWASLLRERGLDVSAYDRHGGEEGTFWKDDSKGAGQARGSDGGSTGSGQNGVEGEEQDEPLPSFWTKVEKGGPEALEGNANRDKVLLLCYPDDFEGTDESLSLQCLYAFEGDVVIHVGELFGDSVCMSTGQAPWGRTTGEDFQRELAVRFHCVLKVALPSWPHARDSLTVWKRHGFSSICYGEGSGTEVGRGFKEASGSESEEDVELGVAGKGNRNRKGVGKRAGRQPGEEEDGDSERDEPGDEDKAVDGIGSGVQDGDEEGAESDEGDVDSILDSENEERASAGFDSDMYAYVPDEERLPMDWAAECVRFLIET